MRMSTLYRHVFLCLQLMGRDHFDSALNGNSTKEEEAQQETTILVLAHSQSDDSQQSCI